MVWIIYVEFMNSVMICDDFEVFNDVFVLRISAKSLIET